MSSKMLPSITKEEVEFCNESNFLLPKNKIFMVFIWLLKDSKVSSIKQQMFICL